MNSSKNTTAESDPTSVRILSIVSSENSMFDEKGAAAIKITNKRQNIIRKNRRLTFRDSLIDFRIMLILKTVEKIHE